MSNWLRDAPAWGVSLIINLAILIAMNLIIFTTVSDSRLNEITTIIDDKLDEQLVYDATSVDQVGTEGDTSSFTASVQRAVEQSDDQQSKMEEELSESMLPDISVLQDPVSQPSTDQLTDTFESRGASEVQGGGTEGVMDRITFEIAQSLKDSKTMVFWVFDASGSQTKRREAIVERFANVYKQLESYGETEGLYTVAASFGQSANLLTPEPVTDIGELKKAIATIKEDSSGVENVFTAVGLLTEKFKKWKRSDGPWNRLVFVVTDERGDDAHQHMENVITEAKRFRFRCFVIGNAAVFGQEKGYVRYVHPDDKSTHFIPVDQGPETAFPQRVGLAFWGGGDARLNRMSSGFGPYALTRLCAETGGMFLVTEQADGMQYDPAVMRSYMPDYRPARVIETEIRQNPAMASLVEASSRALITNITLPSTTFTATSDTILRQEITEAQKPLAELDYNLKELHQLLDAGMQGRDKIKDPRWQASFDLALGRVMAMRVRAYGYNVMLANMKSSPKNFENKDSNEWHLDGAEEIASGPQIRKMAEMATSLLKGIVEKHPATPWATLAAKELERPLGWNWREEVNERAAIMNGDRGEEARLLFEEEEQQRQQMRNRSRVKLPKL